MGLFCVKWLQSSFIVLENHQLPSPESHRASVEVAATEQEVEKLWELLESTWTVLAADCVCVCFQVDFLL